MPHSRDPTQRAVPRLEAYSGLCPYASVWGARPGPSMNFMVPERKMASGHHMSDAGIFVRPCSERGDKTGVPVTREGVPRLERRRRL